MVMRWSIKGCQEVMLESDGTMSASALCPGPSLHRARKFRPSRSFPAHSVSHSQVISGEEQHLGG